jgi:hypothetical protein
MLIPALLIVTLTVTAQSTYDQNTCASEKKLSLTNEIGFILSCIAGITFVSLTVLSKKKK